MSKKGVKQTEEHKRKRAEALRGKLFSDERKRKISESTKGKHSGCNHYMWKGEKFKDNDGYIQIYNTSGKSRIPEHRLVMEKYLGRSLNKNELVHHINEIRDDNRIENLILLSIKEHNNIHFKYKKWSEKRRLQYNNETKFKMSGEKNPFFGKHHSEETKNKIRESLKKSRLLLTEIKNEKRKEKS